MSDFNVNPICDRLMYCYEICRMIEENFNVIETEYKRDIIGNGDFTKIMKTLDELILFNINPDFYIPGVTVLSEQFKQYAGDECMKFDGWVVKCENEDELVLKNIDKALKILYSPAKLLADRTGKETRILAPMLHNYSGRTYFDINGHLTLYSNIFPGGEIYICCGGYIRLRSSIGDLRRNEAYIFIGDTDEYDTPPLRTLTLDITDTENPDNPKGISDKHISRFYSFLKRIKKCKKIFVCSPLGNSAASAVAAAALKYLGGNERHILTSGYDAANMYIYNKICKAGV